MEIDLNKIHMPADIKSFSIDELELLCGELRAVLIRKLSAHGGHVGPNLGVVEATVALHYVFDAPADKIIFDVSHQSYAHKMLTGRMEAFVNPVDYDEVTGFTCPAESRYDLFEIGHTSTAISLATGLAKARDLLGGTENVVAFVGDASLGGGMALESLDYAPELHSNLIIVLNDNQMSIAENHGAMYDHLAALRKSNGTGADNIFKAMGYEYVYVKDGNDVRSLIRAFAEVKDTPRAVVVHINTMKGMGLPVAEADKETFHFSAPFNPSNGIPLSNDSGGEDYSDMFARRMLELMPENPGLVVLNAGTPGVTGFTPERRRVAGKQFVDVGIAEQNCVTMGVGLAKGGAHPVTGLAGTFIQRAYDQLSHDAGINNLPLAIVLFHTGMFELNDVTHLGFFDIAMISNIPNLRMLAPASCEEYMAMLELAATNPGGPLVIRTPGGVVTHQKHPVDVDFNRYEVVEKGAGTAIIAEGPMLEIAREAAAIMRDGGLTPEVVNPRILSAVDAEYLESIKDFSHVVTLEDGIVDGGFGQKVAACLARYGTKVSCLGLKKEFVDRFDVNALLEANGLTPRQIACAFSYPARQ